MEDQELIKRKKRKSSRGGKRKNEYKDAQIIVEQNNKNGKSY